MTLLYHGAKAPIRGFRVQPSQTGVQYGAGIYFTDSIQQSSIFGKTIHIASLDTRKMFFETDPIDRTKIKNIAQDAPKAALLRLDNDPKVAREELIKDATASRNMVDALYVLWYDGFARDGVEFCKACSKHGVTGVVIKALSSNYFIVYDPNIIDLLDTQYT